MGCLGSHRINSSVSPHTSRTKENTFLHDLPLKRAIFGTPLYSFFHRMIAAERGICAEGRKSERLLKLLPGQIEAGAARLEKETSGSSFPSWAQSRDLISAVGGWKSESAWGHQRRLRLLQELGCNLLQTVPWLLERS